MKNRPKPSKYANRIRSPVNEIGAVESASGIIIAAITAVTKPTTGPALNTQVVVVLKTDPFWQSLIRSK